MKDEEAEIERKRGGRVSAQAVGGAVGWNPKTGRTQRKGAVMMMAARCDAGKFSDRIDKISRIMRNGLWS